MRNSSIARFFALFLTISASLSATAADDEFVLANGGRVSGQWLNEKQSPRTTYVIKTSTGKMTLPASAVRSVIQRSKEVARYKELAAGMGTTIEDHWNAAEYCREKRLVPQREHHLQKILKQDPNHKMARAALGYTRRNGRWVNTDQWRRDQGLVLHGGDWRVRQDIESELIQKQRADLEKEWRRNLISYRRTAMRGGKRAPEAVSKIKAIRHSRAVPALAEQLSKKGEPRDLKLLYIDVLHQIGGAGAVDAMIKTYMEDPDQLVGDRCLDILVKWKSRRAVAFFIKQLSHKDNGVINRAGRALGSIGDPSAIPHLINAVTSKHKRQLGGGSPGQLSAGFNKNGGVGGLGVSGKPKIVELNVNNRGVLTSLLAIVPDQVNFDYNKNAWRRWWVDRNTPKHVNLRRIK